VETQTELLTVAQGLDAVLARLEARL
jgi:hypothetical protein